MKTVAVQAAVRSNRSDPIPRAKATAMVKDYEGDYELELALVTNPLGKSVRPKITNSSLMSVEVAFSNNVTRVMAIGRCLPMSIGLTMEMQRIVFEVAHSVGIEPRSVNSQLESRHDFVSAKNRAFMEYFESKKAEGQKFQNLIFTMGSINLKSLHQMNPPWYGAEIESILSAMAIGAWTAFEALAVDLWRIIVNRYPDPFATRILKSNETTIKFNSLSGRKYDLRRCMGDLLTQHNVIELSTLDKIRKAYRKIFVDGIDDIFTNRPRLADLEAVRNVFAHRGGVADDKFVGRVASSPHFSGVSVGSACVLTGPIVSELFDDAVSGGCALLKHADEWIGKNGKHYDQGHQ